MSHSGFKAPSCTKPNTPAEWKLVAMQTHSQRELNSPLPALPPHLTTWQSFCGKCCQKRDHYQGRGGPGFNSGQMPKRECAEFLHKTPISNHHPSVHWRMDHSPALSLCLLSSFASYPLLFLRIKSTESLSLSSSLLLLCHGHYHMYTCNTTSKGRCPQSRDRGLVLANRWL